MTDCEKQINLVKDDTCPRDQRKAAMCLVNSDEVNGLSEAWSKVKDVCGGDDASNTPSGKQANVRDVFEACVDDFGSDNLDPDVLRNKIGDCVDRAIVSGKQDEDFKLSKHGERLLD